MNVGDRVAFTIIIIEIINDDAYDFGDDDDHGDYTYIANFQFSTIFRESNSGVLKI